MESPLNPQDDVLTTQSPACGDPTLTTSDAPVPADAPAALPENEEAPAVVSSDNLPEPAPAEEETAPLTFDDLMDRLRDLVAKEADSFSVDDLARFKQQFYALHNGELRALRESFVAAGGDAEAFIVPEETTRREESFKALMAEAREKKAAQRAAIEAAQQANLEAKRLIVEKIKECAADADNVNLRFQEVKELQARFKDAGEVPPQAVADSWREYQEAVERFYDQLKINKELRDYDFKKNLAEKQALIEEAQRLAVEADVVASFRALQTLHDKWRLIGPVAKDLREVIWQQFKDASSIINKRYQEFFEARKAVEQANEAAKTALCEAVEAIDFSAVATYAAWDDLTRTILDAQAQWKKLGFASRKVNTALFTRFRQTCDRFFAAKGDFFRRMKEELAENMRRKSALVERAEALRESTDWRSATDELVRLQKEWKEIGAVPKKHSDAIWKRFHDACDYFFEQKKKVTGGRRETEMANLKAKEALIDSLRAIDTAVMPREEAIARLREVQAEWATVGYVPFRDKDRVNDAYRELGNKLYEALDLRGNKRRMASFNDDVEAMGDDNQRIRRERERLTRILDSRRAELNTYTNNMGFLTLKSKSGSSMLRELERKADRLRQDIAEMEEKIRLLDDKLA